MTRMALIGIAAALVAGGALKAGGEAGDVRAAQHEHGEFCADRFRRVV